MTRGQRAALGFRAHSGWAAVVALAAPQRSGAALRVVERRRIENCDPEIRGSRQPFHTAEGMALADAEKFIRRCETATARMTRKALGSIVEGLQEKGYRLAGAGILMASGRSGATLVQALSSHTMLHTAEGDFYRNALIRACEERKLPVARVREKELFAQAAKELRRPGKSLERYLSEMGKELGPPWTQDEKLASLAAWLALGAK